MPELPEVETFVRNLSRVIGHTISSADVLDSRLDLDPENLVGKSIVDVRRRGKHIVMDFADGSALVIHLRMSGRLKLERSQAEIPYTRLTVRLDDGERVYFVNPRRLGTAQFCRNGASLNLGLEPLDSEFTPDALHRIASASRAPIKQLLLDQRKIAGIGNIYAAEALWRAEIDPRRPSNTLSSEEAAALHAAVVSVLQSAIAQMGTTLGTSVSDYRPNSIAGGMFQNHLSVYGREGEFCERCGGTIARTVQSGRSTCYCPCCQA